MDKEIIKTMEPYCASLSRTYLNVCAKNLGKDLTELTKSDIPEVSLIIPSSTGFCGQHLAPANDVDMRRL